MKFLTPNKITKKRKASLYTKEPDTIAWLLGLSGILYDIGANVGMYTVFAASRGVRVYAFEPEAQNYALLNKNIIENGLTNVTAYNLALNESMEPVFSELNLSNTEVGASLHAFGENKNYKLEEFDPVFKQGCMGIALDVIAEELPKPDHIKIDVDGFEHLVVYGGMRTIRQAKSVLIEINRNLPEHVDIVKWMLENGFKYDQKQADAALRTMGPMKGVGNYIFFKE